MEKNPDKIGKYKLIREVGRGATATVYLAEHPQYPEPVALKLIRFDDKANTTAADFSDIASHWAKDEISAASNNGWINGYTDGTFRPNNKITRAEVAMIFYRLLEDDVRDRKSVV